jgi:transposase
MMTAVKQCAGIDCAKKDLVVTFSICDQDRNVHHVSTRKFLINDAGLKAFIKWVGKMHDRSVPFLFVIEATGVYHERVTNLLYDLRYSISIVYPKRAKDFSKTLQIKKVTDRIASKYLATMGLEKNLELWERPAKVYRDLRVLTRESERIQAKITEVKNEMEAEDYRLEENKSSLRRLKAELKLLTKQKAEVLKEIRQLVEADSELKPKVEKITSIPGIGLQTAATVVAETFGFAKVKNKRQLVSYAGLDVINQESGTSVWTKPRISKRGNRHLRRAMHMPALSSIRTGTNKPTFIRVVSRTGIKMKGVVAVQRKLLVLMYTLWKNETVYDADFEQKKRGDITSPQELELVRS